MKKRWKKVLVFAVAVMVAGSGIPFSGIAFAAETEVEEQRSIDTEDTSDELQSIEEKEVSTEEDESVDSQEKTGPENLMPVEDEQTDVTESVPMQVQSVPEESALEDTASEADRINIVANGLSEDADQPISVDADLKTVETGQTVTVTAEEVDGYYLSQIRIGYALATDAPGEEVQEGSDESTVNEQEETEPADMVWETLEVSDHQAQFTMPEGDVTVYGDYVSIVWDGTIDLTWYDEDADTYRLQYAAQMAGAAALANGLFNDFPVRDEILNEGEDNEEVISYPDVVDEEGNPILAPGDSEENVVGYVHEETNSGYEVFEDSDGDGYDTTVVGDLTKIQIERYSKASSGSNNLVTTSIRWFGSEHYQDKTIILTDDIDMGGVCAEGTSRLVPSNWSGPNYMPIGGQYAMDPGNSTKKENGYTCLSAYFLGTFDGKGHMVNNICAFRHVSSGIFGNCQAVGMIGLIGHPNNSKADATPVVQNVAVNGMIYGNRSIGGVVGKNDYSNGSVIRNCINFATVYNTDAKGCGGIIGAGWNDLTVECCANFGLVCTGYNKNAGGLIGSCEAIVFDSYTLGYATGEGNGNENAGQALGTNNGGAVWYNCYALKGGGSGTGNTPGSVTETVYGSTYGSAIRVLEDASDLKTDAFLSILNGKVKSGVTDQYGYMDSDEDVTPNTKRNWVPGEASSDRILISDHLSDALSQVASWHDPATEIEAKEDADGKTKKSLAVIASQLQAVDATGMPIPRTFIHDASSITGIVTTGTPMLTYYSGETFDTGDHTNQSEGPNDTDETAEFSIWATFDDGTWQELDDYEVLYQNGGDAFETDDTQVTIRAEYLGKSIERTFSVEVTSCDLLSLAITKEPQNTFYATGEEFDPNGMVVTANYGVAASDTSDEEIIITMKANYEDDRVTLIRRRKMIGISDQSVVYEDTELSGESANAYAFIISPDEPLTSDVTEIMVSHTYGNKTLTTTKPITVLDTEMPRVVKDKDEQTVYITSENDFLWFDNQISSNLYPKMNAALEEDIEINDPSFRPVGQKKSVLYAGEFNGNGHTITLNMERTGTAGLFYDLDESATIRDLTIAGSVAGNSYVGGIAAYLDGGKIEQCSNQANVKGTGSCIGGIVGYVRKGGSQISNCQNNAAVSGASYVGGVAGRSDTDAKVIMESCTNNAEASVTGSGTDIGGIVGTYSSQAGKISLCRNLGTIKSINVASGSAESTVGGLIGAMGSGELTTGWNAGPISGNGRTATGGLIGKGIATSVLKSCYNTGTVEVKNPTAVAKKSGGAGGVAGRTVAGTSIQCCYNAGAVQTTDTKFEYAASLIGNAADLVNIRNNYLLENTEDNLISGADGLNVTDDHAMFLSKGELKKASSRFTAEESYFDRTDCFPGLKGLDEDEHWTIENTIVTLEPTYHEEGIAHTENQCVFCGTVVERGEDESVEKLVYPEGQADAGSVDELIEKIGKVTLESRMLISEAQAAYDSLNTEEQAKVTKFETLKSAQEEYARLKEADRIAGEEAVAVDDLIVQIGEVTLDSGDAITAARDAYNALSDEAKAKVTKLNILTDAEESFNQLQNYTGLYEAKDGWVYLTKGKVDTTVTGLFYDVGTSKWYFIEKGKHNQSFVGVAKNPNNGNWYFVKNGTYVNSFTGVAKSIANNKWYFVRNGQLDWKFTGFGKSVADGNWYFVKNGELDWTFTGFGKSVANDKWYFAKSGKLDWTFTGFGKSVANGKWYFAKNGALDWTFTGFGKSVANGKWYFARKGELDWNFTGVAKSVANGKWYFARKGELDWSYTGGAKSVSNGKWYYVKKGELDWTYTGKAKGTDGVTRNYTKGTAQ